MEATRFLQSAEVFALRERFGTPLYVYDEATLRAQANAALAFPNAFGLTVRYAMKAAPNVNILRLFAEMGLHVDASSGFEVRRALAAGIAAEKISLSAQELPEDFAELAERGVKINACSLRQLERYGEALPGRAVGLRFNPGLGSGGTGKTNVGGPHSSFGIWHEWLPEARELLGAYNLTGERVHTHIGSGSDPAVWERVAAMSLELVSALPDVHTLNLGGGYKVGRMAEETSTDLEVIGAPVKELFAEFAEQTGRRLQLEIEPGTFLVANACSLVSTIRDVVQTGGAEAMTFFKSDTGMTEILRPSLYAAQHPIVVVPARKREETVRAVVVGHCCESGDLLTPTPDNPEALGPREFPAAKAGDLLVIEGVGAYCSSMSAKNYNSFPEAPEVLRRSEGNFALIRQRQAAEQIWANERPVL